MARSPARWMAPLVLLVAVAAVLVVISSSTGGSDEPSAGTGTGSSTGSERDRTTTGATKTSTGKTSTTTTASDDEPRTYRVESGDTLQGIADKTGVPIEQIEELNPDVDARDLTVGQRIRLRR